MATSYARTSQLPRSFERGGGCGSHATGDSGGSVTSARALQRSRTESCVGDESPQVTAPRHRRLNRYASRDHVDGDASARPATPPTLPGEVRQPTCPLGIRRRGVRVRAELGRTACRNRSTAEARRRVRDAEIGTEERRFSRSENRHFDAAERPAVRTPCYDAGCLRRDRVAQDCVAPNPSGRARTHLRTLKMLRPDTFRATRTAASSLRGQVRWLVRRPRGVAAQDAGMDTPFLLCPPVGWLGLSEFFGALGISISASAAETRARRHGLPGQGRGPRDGSFSSRATTWTCGSDT